MRKQGTTFIKDIREGDQLEGVYLVDKVSKRQAKSGKEYLKIEVRDKSAAMEAVAWDETMERNPDCRRLAAGDYAAISGRANFNTYTSKVEIVLSRLNIVNPDSVDPFDFLPTTEKNIDQLKKRLRELIGEVTDSHLRQLLDQMFSDEDFMLKFATAPAAKTYHHAYLGGLLEHSVAVASLAVLFAKSYPELDMSLLLTGAILHDVGKIVEFDYQRRIDYSTAGRLQGHIVLGNDIVCRAVGQVKGFPRELLLQLSHLILSHQGELEYGAAVRPKTREAVVLNLIDNSDAKINGFMLAAKKFGPEAVWTDYQSMFSDYLYLGGQAKEPAGQLPLIPE